MATAAAAADEGSFARSPVSVRQAVLDDAAEIAAAHVASWQTAYRDLLPQALLDARTVERRTAAWMRALQERGCVTHVAVEPNGRIAGFIHTGASRDTDAGEDVGELMSIYLHPERWSQGVGRQLHAAGVAWMAERFEQATLWVLDHNTRARTFYERRGWGADGTVKRDTLGDTEVTEVRYRRSLIDR